MAAQTTRSHSAGLYGALFRQRRGSVDASRQPIVQISDNEALADSRDVAAYFGKQHGHVLRDIRGLSCSDDFRRSNFGANFIKDLTGTSISHVKMTKDGFLFLVLGFNGDSAGKLKEAYIHQFNAMEAELRRQRAAPSIDFNDPTVLLGGTSTSSTPWRRSCGAGRRPPRSTTTTRSYSSVV